MFTQELASMLRQSERVKRRFDIFVTDPLQIQVACNGYRVDNWQELQEQAWKVVGPMVRARWSMHWSTVEQMAQKALKPNASLTELMPCTCIIAPSMVYPCPPWLAELAEVKEDHGQDGR
jgi:hypothetical protein